MLTTSCMKQVNTGILKIDGSCKVGILFCVDVSFLRYFFPLLLMIQIR